MVKKAENQNMTPEMQAMEKLRLRFSANLAPAPARSISRKAWGIDVNTVFVPFFTAQKAIGAEGVQDLPDSALGAPIVLARDKAGNVRVSKSGKLSYRVNTDLARLVKRQQDNYIARCQQETAGIIAEAPKAYAAQVVRQQAAGQGTIDQDGYDVLVFEEALAQAQAEAEAAEAAKAEARAARRNRRQPKAETPAPTPEPERVLATV